ncbi:MAG: Fe-S cluster assembly protein SufD [Woeseiaceae bacterium]|jgi:Fe-S cluster assembly protein SufD|nr:Fe-S cluster assembly protein SufD [Woeseiaceae bacterium]
MSVIDIAKLRQRASALPVAALAPVREAAVRALTETGLPTTRDEHFKYTDLGEISALSERWLTDTPESAPSPAADAWLGRLTAETEIDWIVVRNGRASEPSMAVEGVSLRPMSESAVAPEITTPLAALNAALLEDGLLLDIERTPERPIGLVFLDDAETAPGIAPCRVAIRVADNTRADIVEYYASFGDEAHYSSAFLTLDLARGAAVNHVRIQDRGRTHSQTQNLRVTLGRDAEFRSAAFDFGGKLSRNDLLVDLPERGARAEFNGLYLAGDGQHVDNHTRVDHRVGPATSRQQYRGILSGRTRAVWNGKALVYEGADGTDAEQSNHNLLLSDNAEIDTKPELEIYAEDVRCSHGTTVGQLDEKALFYLRSRGISAEDAHRLLVNAFAASTLDMLPVTAIGQHLTALLEQRLRDLLRKRDSQ